MFFAWVILSFIIILRANGQGFDKEGWWDPNNIRPYHPFYAVDEFERKMENTLNGAKLALHSAKQLSWPHLIPHLHRYEDKYEIMNTAVRTALKSIWSSWLLIIDQYDASRTNSSDNTTIRKTYELLYQWIESGSHVVFRYENEIQIKLIEERESVLEGNNALESTLVTSKGVTEKRTTKVITKIKEYIYSIEIRHEIIALKGNGLQNSVKIFERKSQHNYASRAMMDTTTKRRKEEVDLTWLLQHIDPILNKPIFSIVRSHPDCRTPSNNVEMKEIMSGSLKLYSWLSDVVNIINSINNYKISEPGDRVDMTLIHDMKPFTPVLPLVEVVTTYKPSMQCDPPTEPCNETVNNTSNILSPNQFTEVVVDFSAKFLQLEEQSIQLNLQKLRSFYPIDSHPNATISMKEATLLMLFRHMDKVTTALLDSIHYMETTLRDQLVSAVGSEMTARDFMNYMEYHNRKVYRSNYSALPFSYTIRRSEQHSAEGSIRWVNKESNELKPIFTFPHRLSPSSIRRSDIPSLNHHLNATPSDVIIPTTQDEAVEVTISASTSVKITGQKVLHSLMTYGFNENHSKSNDFRLIAQARQFSSFIILLGRMVTNTKFEPSHAMIVQNKEEVLIPLNLNELPTAKEFKDAIASLSPEQKRFAQAYRKMQLSHTVFGVCIIQIKPQLEKVLNLAPNSLTKEIKLTQDLMELFIKYQIPTDLMAYSDDDYLERFDMTTTGAVPETTRTWVSVKSSVRLEKVKEHVRSIQAMISEAKHKELDELAEAKKANNVVLQTGSILFSGSVEASRRITISGSSVQDGETFHQNPVPSAAPSLLPTTIPSSLPTSGQPLSQPTNIPSALPTVPPSGQPTNIPTSLPNASPIATESLSDEVESKEGDQNSFMKEADSKDPSLSPERRSFIGPDPATLDIMSLPSRFEDTYEKYHLDHTIQPVIIAPSLPWSRQSNAGSLFAALPDHMAHPSTKSKIDNLYATELEASKHAVFDLLDAITLSGALALDHATLHIVVASCHRFDHSLMDTLVKESINPIERVELSTLAMLTTLHGVSASEMMIENERNQEVLERLNSQMTAVSSQ